jgi:hypothetical protein
MTMLTANYLLGPVDQGKHFSVGVTKFVGLGVAGDTKSISREQTANMACPPRGSGVKPFHEPDLPFDQ